MSVVSPVTQASPGQQPNNSSEIPQDASAQENASWWQGLSAAEQASYFQSDPAAIGALDGLPSEARHTANMAVLMQDANYGEDPEAAQELLNRIQESQNGPPGDRLLLLGYVPKQGDDDAQAIVAISNPDSADNVGIFVPGMGSDVAGIGGDIDRMADLQDEADTIPGSGQTSTIVWLGYDAPNKVHNAISSGYATDGAPALQDFTEGLRESHQGPDAQTTIIGHSYGSTVVGTADALDGGLAVDDIVVMGSPGMGYEQPKNVGWFDSNTIDDVDELNIDQDHFWAGAASNDPVTYTQVHGNSPVDWSFGGQRITTDGASGHSEYWKPGTDSLRNQAYILTGNYDQVEETRRRFG